jgi:homoserine kinase
VIAEPVRKDFIPGFTQMQEAALGEGALGCSISGSGPSLFALATSEEVAARSGTSMGKTLDAIGCPHSIILSRISPTGARIVS